MLWWYDDMMYGMVWFYVRFFTSRRILWNSKKWIRRILWNFFDITTDLCNGCGQTADSRQRTNWIFWTPGESLMNSKTKIKIYRLENILIWFLGYLVHIRKKINSAIFMLQSVVNKIWLQILGIVQAVEFFSLTGKVVSVYCYLSPNALFPSILLALYFSSNNFCPT
jgi:hypothetical protein